jgi:ribosomal protein S18 acetylase RimI-like enzyme
MIVDWIEIPGLEKDGWHTGVYHLPGQSVQTMAIVWIDDEDDGAWFIINLHVHPDLRGQGLGRQMLNHIIAAANARAAALKLTVEPTGIVGLDDKQLVDWYSRAGFVFDSDFDGYLMRRSFPVPYTEIDR